MRRAYIYDEKDLFDGLNYIDDQIIEEAQPTGESAGYSDEIYVKIMKPITAEKKTKTGKSTKICTGSKSACLSGGSPCCCSLRHGGCAA